MGTARRVLLGPGEVVVQRGTDDAWESRTDTLTRMACSPPRRWYKRSAAP